MKKPLSTINTTLALSVLLICVVIFGYQQAEKQKYNEFRDKINCEKYYDIAVEKWEDYGERLDEFVASGGDTGLESLERRSDVSKSFYSKKLNTCAVVVYHINGTDVISKIGKGSEKYVDAYASAVIYDALTNDVISQTRSLQIMGQYVEDDIETDEEEVLLLVQTELSALLEKLE